MILSGQACLLNSEELCFKKLGKIKIETWQKLAGSNFVYNIKELDFSYNTLGHSEERKKTTNIKNYQHEITIIKVE